MSTADLSTFRRRFVRAKADPSWPEYDPASDDTFFLGIVSAEFAAHYDQIDCAACGSLDICRQPLSRPDMFGTVTSEKTGHLFGYALCSTCCKDRQAAIDKVDAAFNEAMGGE